MNARSPTPTPIPALRLHLYGAAGWRQGDQALRTLERKHAALLAWLWLEGPTPRARLAGLLWPDVPEDRARANLRQRLLKLRQEAGALVHDQDGLLALAPGVTVAPAVSPGAELLQGLAFDDCEALARWLDGQREQARGQRKRDWLAQVREAAQSQRLDDALYAADQLLQADRESEEAYRALMEVSYLRGDHAAALSAWDRCREMLRQIYGVQPSAATQQLGQTLLEAAQQSRQVQTAWAPTPGATRQLPVSVLRPPRLVGRGAALQALAGAWQAGHVLLVAGVAGLGKSRLLADWQAALARPVAAAACRPGDAVMPYASLSRLLLAAIDRFAPALSSAHALQAARLLPRLANLAGVQTEAVHTDHERSQALLALARLLGDCVAQGCAALVLDDLQFADAASLSALHLLAEPPEAGALARLRFVLAIRSDEVQPDAAALLDALAAGGAFTRVDLQPLPLESAAELLASLGVAELDAPHWAPRLWQQVGGNPAFLLESVKLLLSSDAPEGAAPPALPATIEAVIQRRIALLSPSARHLVQLAAVAGNGYSVGLAAAALACPPIALSEPLRELELRQVFYGRQFVHDVIGAVTRRSVPQAVAEFMHRFVAEHLQQHGGEPVQIAEHWLACAEWRLAGDAFKQAAADAGQMALADVQAGLLDRAIAAFEQAPDAQAPLFDAIAARAHVYESQGHEAVRPLLIQRLQALAQTEAQQIVAAVMDAGWRTNLGQRLQDTALLDMLARAQAAGQHDQAWELARMLAWQYAMNNRVDDGLAMLQTLDAWVNQVADLQTRTNHRLARANILAFGDRLTEAIADGLHALQLAQEAKNWPDALPAMNNLGVMHYWRGEYDTARALLEQARALRERLFGSGGSGLKIDTQLGAVLAECGEHAAAQQVLEGVIAAWAALPSNTYVRTDSLIAENHLAQMHLALGRYDAAAPLVNQDPGDVAERFAVRRLTLRLRWQRLSGMPEPATIAALTAMAAQVASPFNRCQAELELARQAPPAQALPALLAWRDHAVCRERPGLQLHATTLAARAAHLLGDEAQARVLAEAAAVLALRCAPFDMTRQEVQAVQALLRGGG